MARDKAATRRPRAKRATAPRAKRAAACCFACLSLALFAQVHDDSRRRLAGNSGTPGQGAKIKSNIILIMGLCIVGISLSFEYGRDKLLESTPKQLHSMLNQMFMELTLLGFIGIILFFVEQSGPLDELSMNLFDDEEVSARFAQRANTHTHTPMMNAFAKSQTVRNYLMAPSIS